LAFQVEKEAKSDEKFTCSICEVEVGNEQMLSLHLKGKKHLLKEEKVKVT
jgi:hypothetical protein